VHVQYHAQRLKSSRSGSLPGCLRLPCYRLAIACRCCPIAAADCFGVNLPPFDGASHGAKSDALISAPTKPASSSPMRARIISHPRLPIGSTQSTACQCCHCSGVIVSSIASGSVNPSTAASLAASSRAGSRFSFPPFLRCRSSTFQTTAEPR